MNPAHAFLALLTVLMTVSNAEASKDRGGGDLCEKRILEVADDISAWIKAGGSAELNFSADVTLEHYNSGMMTAIDTTKVRCVKPGDKGYPVHIGNTPKACRFDRTAGETFITCDYEVFMNKNATTESDQYVLVHHEYAGIAGVENPNEEISTYSLSSQITYFLDFVTLKKLAIKPKPIVKTKTSNDAEADARIMASCESYRNSVNNKISTFIISKGGSLAQPLNIGTCERFTFHGGKPGIALTLPTDFKLVVVGDDGGRASLIFSAAKDFGTDAERLFFTFWWDKKVIYDNLGKIDGYEYTFYYDDESPNDTSMGVNYQYYYSVTNGETGQFIGGARINN